MMDRIRTRSGEVPPKQKKKKKEQYYYKNSRMRKITE